MAIAIKRHKARHAIKTIKKQAAKLPQTVTLQLEKIYAQSRKKVTKHPYKTAGGILLSVGLASGAVMLVRYLRSL